jgi:hypothetical protein
MPLNAGLYQIRIAGGRLSRTIFAGMALSCGHTPSPYSLPWQGRGRKEGVGVRQRSWRTPTPSGYPHLPRGAGGMRGEGSGQGMTRTGCERAGE